MYVYLNEKKKKTMSTEKVERNDANSSIIGNGPTEENLNTHWWMSEHTRSLQYYLPVKRNEVLKMLHL